MYIFSVNPSMSSRSIIDRSTYRSALFALLLMNTDDFVFALGNGYLTTDFCKLYYPGQVSEGCGCLRGISLVPPRHLRRLLWPSDTTFDASHDDP